MFWKPRRPPKPLKPRKPLPNTLPDRPPKPDRPPPKGAKAEKAEKRRLAYVDRFLIERHDYILRLWAAVVAGNPGIRPHQAGRAVSGHLHEMTALMDRDSASVRAGFERNPSWFPPKLQPPPDERGGQ